MLQHLPTLATLAAFALLSDCVAAQTVDTFEDLGADGTDVLTRTVEGVGIVLSNSGSSNFTARTYGATNDFAFGGSAGASNAPLRPGNVSGLRFISAATQSDVDYFDSDQPLVFTLDAPVSAFGLTTLDLLESGVGAAESLTLRAFDAQNNVVAEHTRKGPQDPSGARPDLACRHRNTDHPRSASGQPEPGQRCGLWH